MTIHAYLQSLLVMLRRPIGRAGLAVVVLVLTAVPTILFFEADHMPRQAFVARDPVGVYCLYSDDVAYVAGSLTWQRTVANLFEPHNTHIVPAWRLLSWALVAGAGNLERVPAVLAVASYSILVAVMLLTGRLVARETGSGVVGLAAMVTVGTTSLMLAPATWYSAGQPLWAGAAILATLWYVQQYRRTGRVPALVLAAVSAPIAGWFWTIGHLAGPAAAVYLWFDGRRRCKMAAAVPLVASIVAVGLSLALGGRRIDSTISFHGRSVEQAAAPLRGLAHTVQSIPENLVLGNLGLTVPTTQAQGAVLTLAVLAVWVFARLRHAGREPASRPFPLAPLESSGLFLVLAAYLGEWTFRGYMDYQYLRTINMRNIVPWYDAIPQIGAVLFVAGWWGGRRGEPSVSSFAPRTNVSSSPARAVAGGVPPVPSFAPRTNALSGSEHVTIVGVFGIGLLALALVVLNRPRVDALVRATVPPLLPSERENFKITRLQTMRANALLWNQAEWQRAYLRRLDRAQAAAQLMGIGVDQIRAAFGHRWIPATVGALRPSLPDLYDAAALLDLPRRGRAIEPQAVRAALVDYFTDEPEPRPGWIAAGEPWPPGGDHP
jgi:hypothetical protein